MLPNAFKSEYNARKTLREIMLLRKLTEMEDNIFTTKVLDIVVPTSAMYNKNEFNDNDDLMVDLQNLHHLFIVMELYETNFIDLLNFTPCSNLSEDHIITILYN